ncbi:MAG: dTMP kinase [Candidatus Doudnabacteria bacterium RIFCSPHIGHO2_01_52_17]|uniref:Thymidylate kinase n=1 Tax=Candidatus Doudnabacteria bacterium RIFCSPHIGHO2_01_52_17 TaxID=1817820 RepID=A0A1F5NCQ3_9BACT|nr:MAG: dTMP kinase [Candidatus Doudnabacteria bacterium RIFCSPHIGHO2_01_52_17]
MAKKGFFVVFEGPDGSGQSTQVELLVNYLKAKGCKVLATKEPTLQSKAGKTIREALDEKIKLGPQELQGLFTKDRASHLKNIILPALKRGKIVISDRYFFSSFAFGAANGVSLDWLVRMNKMFLHPDLTLILDVPAEVSVGRIEKRGKLKTLFEKKQKLEKVIKIYRIFPRRFSNVYLVDGRKPIPKVFQSVRKIVRSKLNI